MVVEKFKRHSVFKNIKILDVQNTLMSKPLATKPETLSRLWTDNQCVMWRKNVTRPFGAQDLDVSKWSCKNCNPTDAGR